mmetsp:Transcript_411/g.861  ORF Transcript_411/g.861 Transcript_411/m.861 type:complete len:1323 (-) Transcript_411:325-4293(-)
MVPILRHSVLVALLFVTTAGAISAPLRPALLRIRGGSAAEVAEVGRAQQPMKRAKAFKIARVLSETFEKSIGKEMTKDTKRLAAGPNKKLAKKLDQIGYLEDENEMDDPFLQAYVNLKLAAVGAKLPPMKPREEYFMRLVDPILKSYQEMQHKLEDGSHKLCPADQRIQNFLNNYLGDLGEEIPQIPSRQLKLDRHGLAKVLSLPKGGDLFQDDRMSSYRVFQGVLHNPRSDKRTTAGIFHVTDEGLPVSYDKKTLPKATFLKFLKLAFNPPKDINTIPYTSEMETPTDVMLSLYLRPLACPEVEGFTEEKSNEVRFIIPGSMVANLDFVESIFANAGNPDLAENDAALDPEHWTGTTACVILAPQMMGLKKKDLGLPHVSKATELQKRDGMCYDKEDELYNDGGPFKVTARDAHGVMVTIISDNYFGYCKKEVKTQLGYTANLYGQQEEEHAGGCLAYPSYDLGDEFWGKDLGKVASKGANAFLGETHKYFTETEKSTSWKEVAETFASVMNMQPEGYGIDKEYDDIFYVPEDAFFSLNTKDITWTKGGEQQSITLRPDVTYILPCGYKVEMVKKGDNAVAKKGKATVGYNQYSEWHLKGTVAEGSVLHKPATVSGGGKSEISKRLEDFMRVGPVTTSNIEADLEQVDQLIKYDLSKMMLDPKKKNPLQEAGAKDLLDPKLSLGRMIRILSPSEDFTADHNDFVSKVPSNIRELLCVVKHHYKLEWGSEWRQHFHADAINGALGSEVKLGDNNLLSSYIRIGFRSKHDDTIPLKHNERDDVAWRLFTLRQDFFPSWKLQTEDDITASVVAPAKALKGLHFREKAESLKFLQNVEFRLFQRPDEAIHRGFDKFTEIDLSKPGNFICNFQPMKRDEIAKIVKDTIGFQKYTEPMQQLLLDFLESDSPEYCVSSSNPRLVDSQEPGKLQPTKNPRYLQDSFEVTNVRQYYLSSQATRLARKLAPGAPVFTPVNAVLCGRRNNAANPTSHPPQPALAVHSPFHYYELPELLMEFASSMTGKSPSTNGAGSEGALTKGPFNALSQIHDLNNAMVSYALTGTHTFITSAGVLGPHHVVDHDISLLIPEVWCRMRPEEKDADNMIKEGLLEKIEDMEYDGKVVPSSVLGYRPTRKFINAYFGRVVSDPASMFPETMLRPEKQGMKEFADGVETIRVTNNRVAGYYFADGSIDLAHPPMKVVLHMMRDGHYEGKKISDPEIRNMFTREAVLKSDWYKERLVAFQRKEIRRLTQGIEYMQTFLDATKTKTGDWKGQQIVQDLNIEARLDSCKKRLAEVKKPSFLDSIHGTLGVDPSLYSVKGNNVKDWPA